MPVQSNDISLVYSLYLHTSTYLTKPSSADITQCFVPILRLKQVRNPSAPTHRLQQVLSRNVLRPLSNGLKLRPTNSGPVAVQALDCYQPRAASRAASGAASGAASIAASRAASR